MRPLFKCVRYSFFQTEVKELKKKLRWNEVELKKVETENSKFLSTLKEVQTKIATVTGGETKKLHHLLYKTIS